MNYSPPEQFANVTLTCKANLYFDGRVVSHAVIFPDGSRKTLGLIYPGIYTFDTDASERMEIIAGTCRVRVGGRPGWTGFPAGTWFAVTANSSFEIEVAEGVAEYVCSYE
ncbi:MAG: hypothetical protein C0617_08995 [Desulfuromonas sp.]|uniref:pyrimidine/purine nucleoside phosphorylase n=1 Tax=Desulfuromonas sp. TaxID=892 RepID=UPI000CC73F99|nr:pyrimidine/purine nucleoside phosphorylase [Desulfuromonas sp.]PLX84203.1 MAG: hypothetical protein C0617_08995 [Desulfuromonas sp.]